MAKAKTSISTENRSGSAADAAAKEQRTEMPLSDLHPFEGHPFKVLDDELMEQTVESIKQIGVVSGAVCFRAPGAWVGHLYDSETLCWYPTAVQ